MEVLRAISGIALLLLGSCSMLPDNYSVQRYHHLQKKIAGIDTLLSKDTYGITFLTANDTLVIYNDQFPYQQGSFSSLSDASESDKRFIVDGFFNLSVGDTFSLKFLSGIEVNINRLLIGDNNHVRLVSKTVISDTLINCATVFTFTAEKQSKGYIGIEDDNSWSSGRMVIVSYCIDALDKVSLTIDSSCVDYFYSVEGADTTWLISGLKIFGKTSAFGLGILDGHQSVPIDTLARSFGSEMKLSIRGTDFRFPYVRIVVRGTIGFDRTVEFFLPSVNQQ